MPKRIVISGYYGFANAGDEAVLCGILKSFKLLDMDAEICVLSSNPEYTTSMHPGISAVNSFNISEVIKAIKQSDILISGGGSLFQDVTSKRSFFYYLFILKLAQFLRKKTVIYAQGIGPLLSKFNKKSLAAALNKCCIITVRDEQSKALLKEIGIKKPITICTDPAFLVETNFEAASDTLAKIGLEKDKFIAVSLRSWKDTDEWLKEASCAIKEASEKFGLPILAVPFMKDDVSTCKLIDGTQLLEYTADFKALKSIICSARLVVGMRLHSLIFAASESVPFVPFSYDPKVDSFAKSMQIESRVKVGESSPLEICEIIENAISNSEITRQILFQKVNQAKQSALIPIEMIKALK